MGGSAGGAPQRNPSKEWSTIANFYGGQENQLNSFLSGPGQTSQLLNRAGTLAGTYNANPTALTNPVGGWLSAFNPGSEANLSNPISAWQGSNTPSALNNLTGPLKDLQGLFSLKGISGVTGPLSAWSSNFTPGATKSLTAPAQNALTSTINPILESGGALAPDQARQVSQDTRAAFAAQGNAHGNQAALTEVLNRQGARDARFQTALGESGAATSEIQGLQTGAASAEGSLSSLIENIRNAGATGATGLSSGIESLITQGQTNTEGVSGAVQGLRSSGLAGTLGSTSGIQSLQTGGLNQLSGTAQAQAGTFSTLTNPILGYLSNLFSGNLQAASAAQTAGSNKSAGVGGGALSAVGTVLGAVATAY